MGAPVSMSGDCPADLSRPEALRVIRALAADSTGVLILGHARKRMRERGFSRARIFRCLQRGSIIEGPFVNARGNWQVTMSRQAAGEETQCVAAIDWATRLLVITVY